MCLYPFPLLSSTSLLASPTVSPNCRCHYHFWHSKLRHSFRMSHPSQPLYPHHSHYICYSMKYTSFNIYISPLLSHQPICLSKCSAPVWLALPTASCAKLKSKNLTKLLVLLGFDICLASVSLIHLSFLASH